MFREARWRQVGGSGRKRLERLKGIPRNPQTCGPSENGGRGGQCEFVSRNRANLRHLRHGLSGKSAYDHGWMSYRFLLRWLQRTNPDKMLSHESHVDCMSLKFSTSFREYDNI